MVPAQEDPARGRHHEAVAGLGGYRSAFTVRDGTDDPTRKTEDLLLGSWELIQRLGRVPRRLIWDNEPDVGRGPRRAEGVAGFMGTLATKLVLLPPRDPEWLIDCCEAWRIVVNCCPDLHVCGSGQQSRGGPLLVVAPRCLAILER